MIDLWEKLSHGHFMEEFWNHVRELSFDLGVKPETSRKWQTNRAIPSRWHHPLVKASENSELCLSWEVLREPPTSGADLK